MSSTSWFLGFSLHNLFPLQFRTGNYLMKSGIPWGVLSYTPANRFGPFWRSFQQPRRGKWILQVIPSFHGGNCKWRKPLSSHLTLFLLLEHVMILFSPSYSSLSFPQKYQFLRLLQHPNTHSSQVSWRSSGDCLRGLLGSRSSPDGTTSGEALAATTGHQPLLQWFLPLRNSP